MLLYVDEHIPSAVVQGLTQAGCDVVRAVDRHPGEPDDAVHLTEATREGRVVVTNDADFLRIDHEYQLQNLEHAGIIYWHQRKYDIGQVIRRVLAYLQTTTEQQRRNRVKFL